jgi:3-hydroxymyristoyl/3-hydroxydecanoyl-(acyl carrier protein) dehydratase
LATFGTVCRSLVQNLLKNDAERLHSYEVRFTGHVYPGESLEIKVWKEQNRLHFEVIDVERKTKVLVGALTLR